MTHKAQFQNVLNQPDGVRRPSVQPSGVLGQGDTTINLFSDCDSNLHCSVFRDGCVCLGLGYENETVHGVIPSRCDL